MNAVGLGSNKARTDAISKWLGLVPGEAANANECGRVGPLA